jgi:sigma-B regulation protein RsbU (phosphoserine phosphatase)
VKLAAEIHRSFLPAEVLKDEAGRFEIDAFTRSAYEVGGDLYAFETLPDGRIGFALGDVSGKGVPAALYMARVVSEFRMICHAGAPPWEVLTRLNATLADGAMRGIFVTFVYGVLDPETGDFELANAGHLPPIIAGGEGKARWMGPASGPPLGVSPLTEYKPEKVKLQPSEAVLFYSDGIVEVQNKAGEQYDKHLLGEAANAEAGAGQLLYHVLGSVEEFSQGAMQADDMTLVAMSWAGER